MPQLQIDKTKYLRITGLIISTIPSVLFGLLLALSLLKTGVVILPIAALIFIAVVALGSALGAWFGPYQHHHDDGHNEDQVLKIRNFAVGGLVLGLATGLSCAAFLSATLGLAAIPALVGVCIGITIFGSLAGAGTGFALERSKVTILNTPPTTGGVSGASTAIVSATYKGVGPTEAEKETTPLLGSAPSSRSYSH